jgi:hypothetical protein
MENDTLQKIDEILRRTNTDYSTAKEALDAAKGDVLEAIILIENQQKGKTSGFSRGEQIMDQLKEVIAKGNATKLTIKKDNEVIINIPITAGLVSALVAPFLSAAGITVALLAKCSVEITQTDGKVFYLFICDKRNAHFKITLQAFFYQDGFYGLFYGIFLVGGDFYSILPVIIQYAYHFFTSCFSYAFTIS